MKYTSLHKILKNSLRLFRYKVQSHQAIPMKAVQQKVYFAEQILTMIVNDGLYVSCIWFTDEKHFYLNGIVYNRTGDYGVTKILSCVKRKHCIRLVSAWARHNISPFLV